MNIYQDSESWLEDLLVREKRLREEFCQRALNLTPAARLTKQENIVKKGRLRGETNQLHAGCKSSTLADSVKECYNVTLCSAQRLAVSLSY